MDETDPQLLDLQTLIRRLQFETRSEDVKVIQRQIHNHQLSPQGWQYADALLASFNAVDRFFGASTLVTKLRQAETILDQSQCEELLQKLLGWFCRLNLQNETARVMNKLGSAFACLYILPDCPWETFFRRLVLCIATQSISADPPADRTLSDLLQQLQLVQASALLRLIKIFVEDISKIDDSGKFDYVHKRVADHIGEAASILEWFFQQVTTIPENLQEEVFECYEAWIAYSDVRLNTKSKHMQYLQAMVPLAMQCLPDNQTFAVASRFFAETLTNHYSFYPAGTSEHLSTLLTQPWAQQYLRQLQDQREDLDEDSRTLMFGQLALSLGHATVDTLIKNSQSVILAMIECITATLNCTHFNESLAHSVDVFWETYNTCSEDIDIPEADFKIAREKWVSMIPVLCNTILLPEVDEQAIPAMDSDFLSYRTTIANLVHDSYAIYGLAVLDAIIRLIVGTSDYRQIEAGLTMLSGIIEFIPDTSTTLREEDGLISEFFNSAIFQEVTQTSTQVPLRMRKLAVRIIGEHHVYLGRHKALLQSAMGFLFNFMQEGVAQDECSKAIFRLCDGNRSSVTSISEQLLNVSELHVKSDKSTATSRENIVGANAAVVSALPAGPGALLAMDRLLNLIQGRLQGVVQQEMPKSDGFESTLHNVEDFQTVAEATLGQLIKVGRACQTPDDAAVDLDRDIDDSMWITSEGLQVQGKIVNMLQIILKDQRNNGPLLEGACDVLRTGYPEAHPGPFVLASHVTVELLTSTPATNPMLYYAIDTASVFISSHSSPISRQETAAIALLQWICQLRRLFASPSDDPEVAYSCVEFLYRCVPAYLEQMLALPDDQLSSMFSFTLECLDAPDPLPKRATCKLWSSLILPHQNTADDHPSISRLKSIVMNGGPRLVGSVIRNVLGGAARSDLDAICELIRHLFKSSYTSFAIKNWLHTAMAEHSMADERVTAAEKARFLAQLVALRGGSTTNKVVKEFWKACRGITG